MDFCWSQMSKNGFLLESEEDEGMLGGGVGMIDSDTHVSVDTAGMRKRKSYSSLGRVSTN
eukprot:scaffold6997_cov39-Attheya_sp.AAC.1